MQIQDISPDWKGSTDAERSALDFVLEVEGTPLAIQRFAQVQSLLGDYWYWFTLGTLWVSYSGWSDLELWRQLFRAGRRRRNSSIMKPSEWEAFRALPETITAYRSHRPTETDWISYTLDPELADRWTGQRGGHTQEYWIKKEHCIALFLRRGESEILMLNPRKARAVQTKGGHRNGY